MLSGDCEHVWGGCKGNTSPISHPNIGAVLHPVDTRPLGGPSAPLPPSASEALLLRHVTSCGVSAPGKLTCRKMFARVTVSCKACARVGHGNQLHCSGILVKTQESCPALKWDESHPREPGRMQPNSHLLRLTQWSVSF